MIQQFLPNDSRYSMLVWSKKYPQHVRDLDDNLYLYLLNKGMDEEEACRKSTLHGFYLILNITAYKFYYITYSEEFEEYQYQVMEVDPEDVVARRISGEKYCLNLTKRSGWMNLPEKFI